MNLVKNAIKFTRQGLILIIVSFDVGTDMMKV